MIYIAAGFAAFAVAWVCITMLIPLLRRRGIVDIPNPRSSHKSPTPRGGGAGIIVGIAAGFVFVTVTGGPLPPWWLLLSAAVIALVGAIDDLRGGLPASIRFSVQIVAASIVIYWGGGLTTLPLPEPLALPLGPIGIPLAILWLIAATNIYNFLDGIDGYAAFQGLLAGLGFALIATDSAMAYAGVVIAGACGGFLLHNWHPARIFMGDVGSTTLGFFFAGLPWQASGSIRSEFVFYAALCLWFFLADGVLTIVKRILRGEAIWLPHRSHLYQQLAKNGVTHHVIVLRVGVMAAAVTLLTVIAARTQSSLFSWIALFLAGILFITYAQWARAKAGETIGAPVGKQM